MIEWLDKALTHLASAMCRSYANYPEESPEYIWMMQDLSRGEFKSIIPNVDFSTDDDLRQYYIVVRDAPFEYRKIFFVHYISREGRKIKMKALKLENKTKFYGLRDQLHSYVLGALNSLDKKSVRTMALS